MGKSLDEEAFVSLTRLFSAEKPFNTQTGSGSTYSVPNPEDITREQLPNGIVVLSRANYNSPSVALSGYSTVGGLFDPDEKLGLASFTSAALMRGTRSRDFQGIYDALESVGARLGRTVNPTVYSRKELARRVKAGNAFVKRVLEQPKVWVFGSERDLGA